MDAKQLQTVPEASVSPLVGWEAAIHRCAAQRHDSVLELARIIAAAKNALPRGDWTRLWQARRLPFSKRKADMLAVIGKQLGGLDAQTFAHLPVGWSVLYHLAQLPRPLFMSLFADGTIHPSLTLAEAKDLLAQFKGKSRANGKRSSATLRIRRFAEFVRKSCSSWTETETQIAFSALHQLTNELGNLNAQTFAHLPE